MATYPTAGGSDGTWGTECSAYHAVSTDLATGKVKDGAVQVSSAPPTEDAALANKLYVDNSTDGDSPTLNDSDSNAMLKSHAYLTQTSGFVTAFKKDTSQTVSGFVGDTDDPAGAGLEVASSQANATSSNAFISFFVAKGKYFEIIKVTDDPTITWTPLTVGGGNPIDND